MVDDGVLLQNELDKFNITLFTGEHQCSFAFSRLFCIYVGVAIDQMLDALNCVVHSGRVTALHSGAETGVQVLF